MGSYLGTAEHLRTSMDRMESEKRGKCDERKMQNKYSPLLIMVQKSILRQKSKEGVKNEERIGACNADHDVSKRLESSSKGLRIPPVSGAEGEKCVSWVDTVSHFERGSSDKSELSSLSPSTSRNIAASRYSSSSYTSWTRPVAAHLLSDSFVPDSDIFDNDAGEDVGNREHCVLAAEYNRLRRRSSADTYKDIDDIEDFEFDDFDDLNVEINDKDEGMATTNSEFKIKERDKRLSGVMSSPDMAYESMNGSEDEGC